MAIKLRSVTVYVFGMTGEQIAEKINTAYENKLFRFTGKISANCVRYFFTHAVDPSKVLGDIFTTHTACPIIEDEVGGWHVHFEKGKDILDEARHHLASKLFNN